MTSLRAARIVPVLDAPMERGTNTVWCASLLAAWKILQEDIAMEPVQLSDAEAICEAMNRAADPRAFTPPEVLYAAAGWASDGIVRRIRSEVKAKFPRFRPSLTDAVDVWTLVAYGLVNVDVRFAIPYQAYRDPFPFTSGDGSTADVRAFGSVSHSLQTPKFTPLPKFLFDDRASNSGPTECIIDLDHTSEPTQVIVAMTQWKLSLAETWAEVEQRSRRAAEDCPLVTPTHRLIVPEVSCRFERRFGELEGRSFLNPGLQGASTQTVLQDIDFTLDRGGARLVSEANLRLICHPHDVFFDRPFLVALRKRGLADPYFVMWVDNPGVLKPFG